MKKDLIRSCRWFEGVCSIEEEDKIVKKFINDKIIKFSNIDFSDTYEVLRNLNIFTKMMANSNLNLPIQYLINILRNNGYASYLELELNSEIIGIDLSLYILANYDLDEVGRYLIGIWLQELEEYKTVSHIFIYFFELYKARVESEIYKDQSRYVKELK